MINVNEMSQSFYTAFMLTEALCKPKYFCHLSKWPTIMVITLYIHEYFYSKYNTCSKKIWVASFESIHIFSASRSWLSITFITLYQILYTNSCELSKCLCVKGKRLVICPVLNLYHTKHLVAKQRKRDILKGSWSFNVS